ncbi:hypothetical protein AVEN_29324-1 [Araneus ventricosus]|uniref:Uncharacterized protein n=1 Tax=Araneus ventricosus TaxID=182803 RepID=A0A4Y2IXZ9_ARAVE|nr:hypothetical protein AVEN_29324-1 [Araneus ventricosus]
MESRTPTPGTSFAPAIKKTLVAVLTPTYQSDLSSETNSKTSGPLPTIHSPVTTAGNILHKTVAPIGEAASAPQDFSDFQIDNSKKKFKKKLSLKRLTKISTAGKILTYYKTPPPTRFYQTQYRY